MLRLSQTKVIFPLITLGLLEEHHRSGQTEFADSEIKKLYHQAVRFMGDFLGHDLHIGGKYYDAYPSRNLPRYGVLQTVGPNKYELQAVYASCAESLLPWIPERIKEHIAGKIGLIPQLGDRRFRTELSAETAPFLEVVGDHLGKTRPILRYSASPSSVRIWKSSPAKSTATPGLRPMTAGLISLQTSASCTKSSSFKFSRKQAQTTCTPS